VNMLLTDIGLAFTFGTSLLAYLASRKNGHRIGQVDGKVETVHALVNNQLDRQLDRNAELTATLTAAGVDVPVQRTATDDATGSTATSGGPPGTAAPAA
jgi:hypothetical protein